MIFLYFYVIGNSKENKFFYAILYVVLSFNHSFAQSVICVLGCLQTWLCLRYEMFRVSVRGVFGILHARRYINANENILPLSL